MLELVQKARRRILQNEMFRQGANTASAALAAVILLLILGTQILNWYWAVLLPLAAIGAAFYEVRKRLPSRYAVAQIVDRRMELADCISTAFYFAEENTTGRSEEIRQLQLAEAERVSQGVDVRKAVPYTIPHMAYAAAALFLIASSVFALRYGITDHLDLRAPLARILMQRLGIEESKEKQAHVESRKGPQGDPAGDASMPADGQDDSLKPDANQPPQDSAEDSGDTSAGKQASKADKNSSNNGDSQDSGSGEEGDQAENPAQEGKQDAQSAKSAQNGNNSQSGGNPDGKNAQNNQSLLSKMKEAMQNLLSSMQQPPNPQQQAQNNANQSSKAGKGQPNSPKQQASKGDKKGSPSSDSQEQQSADEGQEAQNAQDQAERTDSPQSNKQPGNGAGNRDGSKDLKQAEQLAAMGKISEIIGKRSATVTGEATVDVQSTSQQLRTGYQDRRVDHTQTAGEINRDEIPVALESYVSQYFEQVRKQPAAKKGTPQP